MKANRKLVVASFVAASMVAVLVAAKSGEERPSGLRMADAGKAFLAKLSPEQRSQATFRYDDPERLNWHFIPRSRKGLPLKALDPTSRAAARELIATGLSKQGYEQAVNVMSLDDVLYLLETDEWAARRQRRDPLNYYVSVFGTPGDQGQWGWRLEGHHLSLNFSIQDGRVVSSTPEFFGANPAQLDAGPGRSLRVLAPLEDTAREIVRTSTPEQMKTILVDKKAPNEIWSSNKLKPVLMPEVGLLASDMSKDQQALLRHLLAEYLKASPSDIRAERESQIETAGFGKIRMAWWGSLNRNEKHAYRLQGPTFLVEYNDTQNNANHVHSVWRNIAGDLNQAAAP
ncbi:MAG TPA: DUF3500 domain-containing protein [Planctomycetaceae bacterium]|jgi:hypothetical protein|nr:DUF3500 domain-containing protein [Planctomycetaceae bacterium]